MGFINILSIFISIVLSYIGIPMIYNMLLKNNSVSPNYKGENIPIPMGLSFVLVQIISVSIILLITGDNIDYIIFYLFSLTLMGLAGLLDDLIGDKNVKGFKGHIKSFIGGELTTGGIKAGVGFFIALIISIILSENFFAIFVNTLIISLFTNLINLFDLRPGRSIKVFIIISIIMLVTSVVKEYNFILYSFYGILVVYFPLDLKAKSMMGDVGSNVIGITLGVYCAYTHNLIIKIIYLVLLITIHVLAEKLSFSNIIENNKILKFIDDLGR
ncbi:glycosyltransferase [Clostridium sp. Cult2]|uniref:glycosyltransferase n=1 Tax=Clostridium sp. Cult2 TaxID=2079003 RepID=UPI001F4248A7|nr:glycosyltransferase [Clostridium sp. Cult2]MCF6465887.1 phospho-N-acetylmuramoyl-pentapeptide-transferase [Clostridium sp. Cult2]